MRFLICHPIGLAITIACGAIPGTACGWLLAAALEHVRLQPPAAAAIEAYDAPQAPTYRPYIKPAKRTGGQRRAS